MKKFLLAAATGSAIGLFGAVQMAGPLVAQETGDRAVFEQLQLFGDVFDRVRESYVEDVDEKLLIEAAIDGMLSSLDPHSSFLTAEQMTEMREQTRGSFGGLGIEVTQEDGFVKVVAPMDDTPADKAGILAGDFVTQVDGTTLLGLTLDDAVVLMRGPVGSEIILTIVREGTDEPFDVKIVRDEIKLKAASGQLLDETVVVRIATFNEQTMPNVQQVIDEALDEAGGLDGVNGFVIDMRNNPGGLLSQAIEVSDAFLERGEIVSTRGRSGQGDRRSDARPGDLAGGKPIVVLINGGSASASEIVAGALQDHKRAIVVGTKSFGKGSVQTLLSVAGGGAMRLTTERYYTPSGRSIQALGVSPDIVVEQPAPVVETEEETEERAQRTESSLRGSLSNDSVTEEQRLQIEAEQAEEEEAARLRRQDFQLSYAVDLLKGLSVLQRSE